ncbi:pyridoxamine 5'-phosphate oxidase family protein [Phreatobacter stygius]|uniref:Pyridoxamine 5'-phosphate oxidase family protein n=1 Tax=Phreatobacter stygius TaxID=1940610 RepID=A0A4D7BPW0_9HYPH|nr:pyridoxamine 5'-phosphate oxidase family protein [Phreatobacter stygius]QCI69562.1 pyridoxamine 5'-phosphate oxidase family protein [Phreatobacter stygius]
MIMWIDDEATLMALYGEPGEASIVKEVPRLTAEYRAMIVAAPFCVLATAGADGLDATPRGDAPGFVEVQDDTTLILPDRRGNNRLDSLKNLLRDPRVGLLFMVPGINETLRVNGRARISADPDLLARYAVDGKEPRSVLVITIDSVYFQCSRALHRSRLWDPAQHRPRGDLPSAGQMLKGAYAPFDAQDYDKGLAERQRATLY